MGGREAPPGKAPPSLPGLDAPFPARRRVSPFAAGRSFSGRHPYGRAFFLNGRKRPRASPEPPPRLRGACLRAMTRAMTRAKTRAMTRAMTFEGETNLA
ncbi:MAG: hypothetical protein LBR53_01370 [Deltaproteobacteria bacterium]|nr:hypothetical protein [Deltaproteobacteria bacterium]